MRIYEVNAWTWLADLAESLQRPVSLADVPEQEWDAIASFKFDAVWLMGVWRRSPASRVIAQADANVNAGCAAVCPGFLSSRDVVGSPYSVAEYRVDDALGGRAGLAVARQKLAVRGLKLILDYVPNHTAPDHPWIAEHPEYYVQGSGNDVGPRFFRSEHGAVLAYGAPSSNPGDAWTDTAQLNGFNPGLREEAVRTLIDIASQCDGVRCDMAMLLQTDAFASAWGTLAGPRPAQEFWVEVIGKVRRRQPNLIFIAEAYSNTEWALQNQGFDFCYDKDLLYERLSRGTAGSLLQHLQGASLDFQKHLLHFIENHDEPPAVEAFKPLERLWMAAVAIATLPGASLWFAGQFQGRWGKAPVQLGRSASARRFYRLLLRATDRPAIRQGDWALCRVADSDSMVAWCWAKGDDRILVVLNMSEDTNNWGRIAVPWNALKGRQWKLRDLLRGEEHCPRDGDDMFEGRLLIQPRKWGADLFEIEMVPG